MGFGLVMALAIAALSQVLFVSASSDRLLVVSSSSMSLSGTTCLYPCLNGSTCKDSVCQCKQGFVGIDCARRGCATNCNHRGYCDMSSTPSTCLCFPGFTGLECEITDGPTSVQATSGTTTTGTTTGSATTGTKTNSTTTTNSGTIQSSTKPVDRTVCVPECHPVQGVCWQGQCACMDGFTGKTCTDYLCPDDCSGRGKCLKATGECECYRPYTGKTCAGASAPIIPRPVDTLADVVGGIPGENKPTINVKSSRFIGKQSDHFHLIEQASHVEYEYADLEGLDE